MSDVTLRVLVVDDSPTQLLRTQLALQSQGFEVSIARDGREAWTEALASPPDVIVSDVLMPHIDGFQLCRLVRSNVTLRSVPFILMTTTFRGDQDRSLAMDSGADDFIDKAVAPEALETIISEAVERRRSEGTSPTVRLANRTFSAQHADRLRERLLDKATEVEQAYEALSRAYDETLEALVATLDLRDTGAPHHSWRVAEYALALGRRLELDDEALTTVYRGSLLSDIGMIGVDDAVLRKAAALDADEVRAVRRHPELGYESIAHVEFLHGATDLVLTHHEHWDGTGYPQGLAGEGIPVGARILAVADALDAITTDRPHRRARPFEVALAELERCRGTQFDPSVVDAATGIGVDEWARIRSEARGRCRERQTRPAAAPFWDRAGTFRLSRAL